MAHDHGQCDGVDRNFLIIIEVVASEVFISDENSTAESISPGGSLERFGALSLNLLDRFFRVILTAGEVGQNALINAHWIPTAFRTLFDFLRAR
jgi:hypothetical protein